MTPEYNVTISIDDLHGLLLGAATFYGIAQVLGEDELKNLLTDEQKEIAAKATLQFVEEVYESL